MFNDQKVNILIDKRNYEVYLVTEEDLEKSTDKEGRVLTNVKNQEDKFWVSIDQLENDFYNNGYCNFSVGLELLKRGHRITQFIPEDIMNETINIDYLFIVITVINYKLVIEKQINVLNENMSEVPTMVKWQPNDAELLGEYWGVYLEGISND